MVTTDAGPVRGTVTERGRAFLGVPFAAPPVGSGGGGRPSPRPVVRRPGRRPLPGVELRR
ncbi:carboxylesterase family protein [Streptomyces griseocarneus]|uniref:Carboxylesterase family protein n=1 Tax=Streptomyces griseocarneus TaxID=51201 RepID=A0ABX7S006_9ACTN|nr:carboxylesterase family protein [Streptomyces griseocarneus]QSY52779.1 carboxylesterase family protein [Streptomyces griseocarneus]